MSLPTRLPNGQYGKGRKITTVMFGDEITWSVRDERRMGYAEVSSDTETVRFMCPPGSAVNLTMGRAKDLCPDPSAHEPKKHWWQR